VCYGHAWEAWHTPVARGIHSPLRAQEGAPRRTSGQLIWTQFADSGAVPTHFLLLRGHILPCVSVVMAPLIEEYLVLLLSLRIITCRSSRHV
jgi:hypothetical protein